MGWWVGGWVQWANGVVGGRMGAWANGVLGGRMLEWVVGGRMFGLANEWVGQVGARPRGARSWFTRHLIAALGTAFQVLALLPACVPHPYGFYPSSAVGFEGHNVAVNPDKTKLSFALQLAAPGSRDGSSGGSATKDAASAAGSGQGAVMPATVWRSGEDGGCVGKSKTLEALCCACPASPMFCPSRAPACIRHSAAAGAVDAAPVGKCGPGRLLLRANPPAPAAAAAGEGATFVKWCGLLLNSQTLELQGDYTR